MPLAEWKRRIHPDDLGAFIAAADSCHHGGDRFECEYRLLAAGHRWLWVLHRGRVVQRDRDGSALRITGLLLDIDRRKSEEVARSDSESRLATALWGARAAFWQWHVPSNARTASPLWLAMTGYSRAQWDAMPNPWFSNLHPDDRERVDRQLREHAQGMRDSVEFEYRFQTAGGEYRWMQDRGRAVEWDLQGRPVLVIGVTLDIDAAKRAEAHLRSSESMLETAAWGAGIGLWETNFVTDTTRWFNDWCDRHDIDPCDGADHVDRWDSILHPDEGPEATRRFREHVAGKAEYYDAEYRIKTRSGVWRWVFERGRVVERDAQGKARAHARRVHGSRRDQGGRAPRQRAQRARRGGAAANYRRRVGLGRRAQSHQSHRRLLPRVRRRPRLRPRQHQDLARSCSAPIRTGRSRDSANACCTSIPRAQVLETEYRFRHTDGSWHWALDRAYVVDRAPDGSTRRVLGLVVDITARKIRETALSAADQRFRAVARELRCVIYEIDAETGLSTGEGVRTRARLSQRGAAARHRLGGARASGRPAAARAMVRPRRRIHGRAPVPHPASRRSLRHAARLALRGARRRGQGGAHRRRRHRHQRAGARRRKQLRASQELLQIVAAGTGDWLILVDTERRVQFINRGIRAYSRESIIGQRLDEIAVTEDRPSILAALTQVLQTGEPVDLQTGEQRQRRALRSTRASAPCARRAASPAP